MKKINLLSYKCGIGISLCLILQALSCKHPMSESVMRPEAGWNGSFEIVEQNLPVNWLVNTPKTTGEGDFEILTDSINFKSGKQSLHFLVHNCSNKGGRFSPGIAQEIPLNSGEQYRISFWVKNQDCTFSIEVNGVDAFNQNKGPQVKSAEKFQDWKFYEMNYTLPKDMKRLRFSVSILNPGEFWIDDISISKMK